MGEIKLFEKKEFGAVRIVIRNGNPWFGAKDVATALGYADTDDAVRRHCNYAELFKPGELPGLEIGPRGMYFIPEPDVYRLVVRSALPTAKVFEKWVFEEVLPAIRKTGGYVMAKPDDTPEAILARAVLVAQDTIRRIEAERDEAIRTKAEIGSRREATAMATASAAVRKAAALENELGRGRDYKSVKGIPWFLDLFADTPAAYSVAGRKLSDMSRRMDYEIREIEDSRFGSVKAYHVDVIEAFRLALKNDLNMMRKYRLRRAA